jgi:mRNA-degrading endonuclease toxin of MazEF toxin-antitoxin module
MPDLPKPLRGEIWDVDFPSDPPGKRPRPRPVLIVSINSRNTHQKATSVLVVPFTTTLSGNPLNAQFSPGQTGLPETSELRPSEISTVRKEYLKRHEGTRTQAESVIKAVARSVVYALGVQPKDIQ